MSISKLTDWMDKMQSSGNRRTGPRYVVAEILAQSERALTPQDVFDRARKNYPTLGLVSVYRAMEKMAALGLIQRVHLPEKCQAYISAFSGHEHLLVCNRCGLVEFFRGDDLAPLVQRVEEDSGYRVDTHWLQLFGLCRACQAEGASESSTL